LRFFQGLGKLRKKSYRLQPAHIVRQLE